MGSDQAKKPDADKVGFRNPPQDSRFKPGQSGNPNGRPRGSRNFRTDVKAALNELINVQAGGKRRNISRQEALLLRLCEQALGGNARALDRLLLLAQAHNNDEEKVAAGTLSETDQELLDLFAARIRSGAAGLFVSGSANKAEAQTKSDLEKGHG